MARDLEIPDFAALLQPVLGALPRAEIPGFLAGLERSAADRYRAWAEACDDAETARGLLGCAEREDEIARRAAKLFPLEAAAAERVEAKLPDARRTYLAAFEPHTLEDQWRIQASAERQGAAAWRGIAEGQDDTMREELEGCARLEEESASFLDSILSP